MTNNLRIPHMHAPSIIIHLFVDTFAYIYNTCMCGYVRISVTYTYKMNVLLCLCMIESTPPKKRPWSEMTEAERIADRPNIKMFLGNALKANGHALGLFKSHAHEEVNAVGEACTSRMDLESGSESEHASTDLRDVNEKDGGTRGVRKNGKYIYIYIFVSTVICHCFNARLYRYT